jgi:UDPglucose 6-dehydrogenase
MREAPSLVLIDLLIKAGCKVKVYDPISMAACKNRIGNTITYCNEMYDAALETDALLLVTEWKEFRVPSWSVLQKTMNQPVIVDGRNIYDRKEVEKNGFSYYCIG